MRARVRAGPRGHWKYLPADCTLLDLLRSSAMA